MKVKKEYIILAVIIIALCVYLLTRSGDRTHYQLPTLAEFDSGNISKIEISKDNDTITLIKKDSQWYLEPMGYLADTQKVNGMLAVFETLSLAALVSESKDYQRYDLNPEKRVSARAWQGDALMRNLDIGKAAPSFRHTFVKLGDDSRVFHANDNFRSKFDQTLDNLRDRGVLSFQITDIQSLQLTKDQESVELIRNEIPVEPAASQPEKTDASSAVAVKFVWQDRNGKNINDQDLSRLLTTLSTLKCAGYINDRKKDSFSGPIYTVKLKGAQEHQLDIFAKLENDPEHHPAVSSGSDYPFLLSDSQIKQIMKDPAEMLKTPQEDKKTSE
ncbi:MAG: DUF4340 domain-containing protein [Desulfobacterales bacterium]|nr:DUF4340 domain-containing protein [Desulfobacterales bacterium]